MSARAAWRLESLGFGRAYHYAPGRADWRAAGWPMEGTRAATVRALHVVRRDVPVCSLDDPVDVALERARRGGLSVCVVVNDARVVLGRIRANERTEQVSTPVSAVMEEGPTTIRADEDLAALADRMRRRRVNDIIVADPDGVLIGIVFRADAERRLRDTAVLHEQALIQSSPWLSL